MLSFIAVVTVAVAAVATVVTGVAVVAVDAVDAVDAVEAVADALLFLMPLLLPLITSSSVFDCCCRHCQYRESHYCRHS